MDQDFQYNLLLDSLVEDGVFWYGSDGQLYDCDNQPRDPTLRELEELIL